MNTSVRRGQKSPWQSDLDEQLDMNFERKTASAGYFISSFARRPIALWTQCNMIMMHFIQFSNRVRSSFPKTLSECYVEPSGWYLRGAKEYQSNLGSWISWDAENAIDRMSQSTSHTHLTIAYQQCSSLAIRVYLTVPKNSSPMSGEESQYMLRD